MGILGDAWNWVKDNPTKVITPLLDVGGLVTDYIGGKQSAQAQADANRAQQESNWQNLAYQEKFAKEGLRWRVADAEAAGLHPLAALGATGANFSPQVFVPGAVTGKAEALSRMGQNLSRAAMATQSDSERRNQEMLNDAMVFKTLAEGDYATASAALARKQAQTTSVGPAFPDAGPTMGTDPYETILRSYEKVGRNRFFEPTKLITKEMYNMLIRHVKGARKILSLGRY